jgi:hypothetical protein
MNERTDSHINQQPSILQEIDTPTHSGIRAEKIHMNSNRMVRNYVIIVGEIIMQVILVCVEQKENLVLYVENKIVWRLCAVVVKGTIFQTKERCAVRVRDGRLGGNSR